MSKIKVGIVSYINAIPFVLPYLLKQTTAPCDFVFAKPTTLNHLLKHNEVDVALTSSIEFFEGYSFSIPFCIAAKREIMSVNLYYKNDLENSSIALTPDSKTSVFLLKLLCYYHWKIKPRFVSLERDRPLTEYDAFLLIGNEALEKQEIDGYKIIDLASVWYEMTSLPFVFALFLSNSSVNEDEMHHFKEYLQFALKWSFSNYDTLISYAQNQTQIKKTIIRDYFQCCHYNFSEEEKSGLKTFGKYLNDLQ